MTTVRYMAKLLDDALALVPSPSLERPPRDARGRIDVKRWRPPAIYPPDIPGGRPGTPEARAGANLRRYQYWHGAL